MKKLSYFSSLIFLVILSSNCARRYSNSIYTPQPIVDLKIAILPYEVVTTGRITELLTREEIEGIENAEQTAFQTSMYHQLINRPERMSTTHRDRDTYETIERINNRITKLESLSEYLYEYIPL